MKDLFKKKNTAPKAAQPKKSLFGKKSSSVTASKPSFFGKKPSTKVEDSSFDQFSDNQSQSGLDGFSEQPAKTSTKEAKKMGLFSKKPTSDKKLTTGIVSGAKTAQKPKSLQLDTQKLLPVLIGLFLLVVAALVAKMFLFNDEPVATPAPSEPAAAPSEAAPNEPAPTEANAEQAPTPTDAPTEANATNAAEASAQTNPPQATEPAPVAPVDGNAAQAAPAGNLSYEEFIQETEKKVYRERTVN